MASSIGLINIILTVPIYDLTDGFDFRKSFADVESRPLYRIGAYGGAAQAEVPSGKLVLVAYYVTRQSFSEPRLFFNVDWAGVLN